MTLATFLGSRLHLDPRQKWGSRFRLSGQEAVIDEIFGWWGLDSRAVGKKTV